MQIEKKQNTGTLPLSAVTSCAMKVAHDYAAAFPTRLALARWTHGGDIPHSRLAAQDAPTRAGWYDRTQHGFQGWLEAGGFHQPELDDLDSAIDDCLASK